MKLKVKLSKISAGRPIAFIHEKDAEKNAINVGERIKISSGERERIAVVDIASGFLSPGEIILSEEIVQGLKANKEKLVEIGPSITATTTHLITSKIHCEPYSKKQLKQIMKEIVSNSLTEAEIAYFVSGVAHCGMSEKETVYLTEAVFETGKRLKWNTKTADKHSIGGVAGNRTTPIVVSICAAAGIRMPKNSSRAITSASGTADTIETIAKVDFSIPELRKIVDKTNACLVWGGSLGLAPADDKLIRVEKILNVDPEPQLLASILSKKLAAGSKCVLIDIPYGDGAKVSRAHAQKLEKKFIKIGKKLGLTVKVVLTDGSQPIGNGVGPALEINDIVRVLKRVDSPKDLERKSILLASIILETMGKAKKGSGRTLAKKILDSGQAYDKFKEIIEAQHGKVKMVKPAKLSTKIKAQKNGKITFINNKLINRTARLAGSPIDKTSGLYLHKHKNEKVKKGETLVTIYARSKYKLKEARNFYIYTKPIKIS